MASKNKVLQRIMSPGGAVILACVVVLALGSFFMSRSDVPSDSTAQSPEIARNRTVEIGGIQRPASDVKSPEKEETAAMDSDQSAEERLGLTDAEGNVNPAVAFPYGKLPHIAPNTNETTKEMADYRTRDPERLARQISPFAEVDPFDFDAFKRDPAPYLRSFVPARVWQTAQPGPEVPPLAPAVRPQQTLRQGESIRLGVKTLPNAPVTFTTFDTGEFDNRLPSITVQANDKGVAEARFSATPGTVYEVNVLAASPVASGQAQFLLNVLPDANTEAP